MAEFQVGDEVFGIRAGANAEYLAVPESGVIALKPAMLSYEQAAATPDGSLLALTCLRPADPQGKRVLVYGAAGSVGSAAVQLLAHHFGAEVEAVCDTRDLEVVQSLGAQVVLDRLHEDFTMNHTAYDMIFDSGRQVIVPSLPALAGARRDVRHDGPRLHVPRSAARSRHAILREQACKSWRWPLPQGGPAPNQ